MKKTRFVGGEVKGTRHKKVTTREGYNFLKKRRALLIRRTVKKSGAWAFFHLKKPSCWGLGGEDLPSPEALGSQANDAALREKEERLRGRDPGAKGESGAQELNTTKTRTVEIGRKRMGLGKLRHPGRGGGQAGWVMTVA